MHACIFVQDERKSKDGNLQVYTQSFIKCLKFLKAPSHNIQTVRSWSNNFQKSAEIHRSKSWQSLAANGRWLTWKAILDTVKSQRDEYEAADGSVATAWEAVKLAVLLIYTSLPPGRSHEYATMKLQFNSGDLYAAQPDIAESNWLFVSNDYKKALLYIGSHKTSRRMGVQKIELTFKRQSYVYLIGTPRRIYLQASSYPDDQ